MSESVDERIREIVRTSSEQTREAIFEDLLRELIANTSEETEVPLLSSSGALLGFFTHSNAQGRAPMEIELAVQALRTRHHMTEEEMTERAQFEFKPEELVSA